MLLMRFCGVNSCSKINYQLLIIMYILYYAIFNHTTWSHTLTLTSANLNLLNDCYLINKYEISSSETYCFLKNKKKYIQNKSHIFISHFATAVL